MFASEEPFRPSCCKMSALVKTLSSLGLTADVFYGWPLTVDETS